jgi:hypothetical protein
MVLLLAIILLSLLLVMFIYEIITTPVAAVDAPTLLKSRAASAPSAGALPDRRRHSSSVPARSAGQPGRTGDAAALRAGPAPRTSRREASRLGPGGAAVLAIGGLAAGIIGAWMLHRPARGATACSPHAIQICSQGSVVLTGSQLAGAVIAVVGIMVVVIAGVLAAR